MPCSKAVLSLAQLMAYSAQSCSRQTCSVPFLASPILTLLPAQPTPFSCQHACLAVSTLRALSLRPPLYAISTHKHKWAFSNSKVTVHRTHADTFKGNRDLSINSDTSNLALKPGFSNIRPTL